MKNLDIITSALTQGFIVNHSEDGLLLASCDKGTCLTVHESDPVFFRVLHIHKTLTGKEPVYPGSFPGLSMSSAFPPHQ